MFNPLTWIAALLRAPFIVFERAGLVRTEEERSRLVGIYIWFLRILILLILAFAAARLGLSIPWSQITAAL
jgi:hypothetical protein